MLLSFLSIYSDLNRLMLKEGQLATLKCKDSHLDFLKFKEGLLYRLKGKIDHLITLNTNLHLLLI